MSGENKIGDLTNGSRLGVCVYFGEVVRINNVRRKKIVYLTKVSRDNFGWLNREKYVTIGGWLERDVDGNGFLGDIRRGNE